MYAREQQVAIEAVRKACHLCQEIQATTPLGRGMIKEDCSPVTIADFGVQSLICLELRNAFPDDKVMGEEDSAELKAPEREERLQTMLECLQKAAPGVSRQKILEAIGWANAPGGSTGRFWVLDPIDGTKGFLRGDQYAIALALVVDGQVVLGVLGCPNLPVNADKPEDGVGCLFFASEGRGAWMSSLTQSGETMLHVATTSNPSHSTICESVEATHSSHPRTARIATELGVRQPPVRMDSQCKYGLVARGEVTIYLRFPRSPGYREYIWDHAAGSILVCEAGGRVSDQQGQQLDFSKGRTLPEQTGILVTNGRVHENLLSATQELLRS